MGLFSNMNLDGRSPLRVQPGRGEWGPVDVPSTRLKRWVRIIVPIIAVAIAVGVFFLGRYFYLALIGA
ncbi:MAG TPA: hypothetical protein PKE40_06055 [Arachnia sp.]|nr:hypothetical protein [Arachnia sp.]HMT85899.1 hypothetical protein [Arachnia sp.]